MGGGTHGIGSANDSGGVLEVDLDDHFVEALPGWARPDGMGEILARRGLVGFGGVSHRRSGGTRAERNHGEGLKR